MANSESESELCTEFSYVPRFWVWGFEDIHFQTYGSNFRPEYETWELLDQVDYEIGRLHAVLLKSRNITLPYIQINSFGYGILDAAMFCALAQLNISHDELMLTVHPSYRTRQRWEED